MIYTTEVQHMCPVAKGAYHGPAPIPEAVSYTHLDVYKRQQLSGNAEADAEDISTLRTLAAKIKDTGATFGLQTGDYIDNAGELGSWDEIQSLFAEEFARYPIVQVMGNHEYYGDLSGQHAETAFNLPDEDFYSVEYGNVYMAVINCNANLEAAAKWLVQDAAKSDCPWKVLTVHQPPYYTNPKGSSANYHDALPAAVDEAGIDFVFSGHDHACLLYTSRCV